MKPSKLCSPILIGFLLVIISSSFISVVGFAQTPDTLIVAGPERESKHREVIFWWVGVSSQTQRIVGYYYGLDDGDFVFTAGNRAVFYELSHGKHTFTVKAVSEDFVEDATPATHIFYISEEIQTETEPNDTPEEAGWIGIAEPIYAYSTVLEDDSGPDDDWFKFRVTPAVRQISVFLRRKPSESTPHSSMGLKLQVFKRPLLTKIGEITIDGANNQRAHFTSGVTPGDYFIHITPVTAAEITERYTLTVLTSELIEGVDWDVENNDAAETAPELSLSASQRNVQVIGDTNWDGDVDWYKIHIKGPQWLRLSVARPLGVGSTSVDIYSSAPILEEKRVGSLEANVVKEQYALCQTPLTLGNYFVKVDNTNESALAPYVLNLQLEDVLPKETIEVEPNGIDPQIDRRRAAFLPIGKRLRGTSWDGDADIDWYRIIIPAESEESGILHLTLERASGIGATKLELFDLSLSQIAETDINVDNFQQASISRPGLKPGEHFIKITPQGEDAGAPYQLTALHVKAITHNAVRADGSPLPLGLGKRLQLVLNWTPHGQATFGIADNREPATAIPFFDDGKHGDGDASDGIYVGTYTVVAGDDVADAALMVYLQDNLGNTADLKLADKITIDTVAPEVISLTHNGEGVLITGESLKITLQTEPDITAEAEAGGLKIALFDDGEHADGDDGDGVYVGTYLVQRADTLVGVPLVIKLTDAAGNTTIETTLLEINISGDAPKIESATINVKPPTILKLGDVLNVTLKGIPDNAAAFALYTTQGIIKTLPMYDDGEYGDGAKNDGIYAGTYQVTQGDNFPHLFINVSLTDKFDRTSTLKLPDSITVDGQAPEPVTNVQGWDRPDDEGFVLLVEWDASAEPDFSHYNIYFDDTPISTEGERRKAEIGRRFLRTSQTGLQVENNFTDYYIAVTAVDKAGNESDIRKMSITGPLRARDNRPPPPVEILAGYDTPDDLGGKVTLFWNKAADKGDFSHYNIYLSEAVTGDWLLVSGKLATGAYQSPIINRDIFTADISTLTDGVDYFLAITAVDISGNESTLTPNSAIGPIQSAANLSPQPSKPIRVISNANGLVRHSAITFHWNRFVAGEYIPNYLYRLDNEEPRVTSATSVTFWDVPSGKHQFTVVGGAEGERDEETAAYFTISPALIPEREPNNSPATATRLPLGFTITGTADTDYYRIDCPETGVLFINYAQNAGNAEMNIYKGTSDVERLVETAAGNQRFSLSFGGEKGAYILEVISPDTAAYKLSVDFSARPIATDAGFDFWEIEPNDTDVDANSLTRSDRLEITATGRKGDEDWYQLTGPTSPKLLKIKPSNDANITIYSGSPAQPNNRIGQISNTAEFATQITPGEDYLVQVQSETDYKLALNQQDIPTGERWELEPNNTASTASPLLIGNPVKGTGWEGDADWYRVETAEPGMLVCGFVGSGATPSRPEATLSLRNAALDEIAQVAASETTPSKASLAPANFVPAGVYFLEVMALGEYTISPFFVTSASHDAEGRLTVGDRLTVRLNWAQEGRATASIRSNEEDALSFTLPPPDDGLYLGTFTLPDGIQRQEASLYITLDDTAAFEVFPPFSIDTLTSPITAVAHDASSPLIAGDILTVTLTGEAGGLATGDIGDVIQNLPLYDDGEHADNDKHDGVYVGQYEVKAGDDVENAPVRGKLLKQNGRQVAQNAKGFVTIDTIAPAPPTNFNGADKPGDEGKILLLTWEASASPDTSHYQIYLTRESVGTLAGLKPALLVDKYTTGVKLQVDSNSIDYFLAITAVDKAGNQSPLSVTTVIGPRRAGDNLAPAPIGELRGYDTPDDFGSQITLEWTLPSTAKDFAHYNVRMSAGEPQFDSPISSVPVLQIPYRHLLSVDVKTEGDGVDHYFAVTAVDTSGNESPPAIAGPVQSASNLPPPPEAHPVQIISGPSGLLRSDDVAFHWTRFHEGYPLAGYFYKLDDGDPTFTTNTTVVFYNLTNAPHTFAIKTGSTDYVTHQFTSQKYLLKEMEPNDNPTIELRSLPLGVIISGDVPPGDIDYYRLPLDGDGALDIFITGDIQLKIYQSNVADENLVAEKERALPFSPARSGTENQDAPGKSVSFGVENGEYLVEISGAGEYELSVRFQPISAPYLAESEPNDFPELADEIPLPKGEGMYRYIWGTAQKETDADWYKLLIPENGVGNSIGLPLLQLTAFAEEGVADINLYSRRHLPERLVAKLQLTANTRPTGNVITQVEENAYLLSVDSTGRYTIQVGLSEIPAGEEWELEPNSTSATASPFDSQVTGDSFDGDADVDWFQFDLKQDGILLIKFTRPNGVGSTDISLHRAEGEKLAEIRVPPAQDAPALPPFSGGQLQIDAERGRYSLQVKPEGENPTSQYRLTKLLVPAAEYNISSPSGQSGYAGLGDAVKVELTSFRRPDIAPTFDVEDVAPEIPLYDDGAHNDGQADDGKYAGEYHIREGDNAAHAAVIINLTERGEKFSVRLAPELAIDTRPPQIQSLNYDAKKALISGEVLTVTLVGEEGARASFKIEGLGDYVGASLHDGWIEMFDDAQHDDGEADDGIYVGLYQVKDGDNANGAQIISRLIDAANNESTRKAGGKITIDTTPPRLLEVQHDATQILVEGNTLRVTLTGESREGYQASFSIGEMRRNLALFDDGQHHDGQANDGTYARGYPVKAGDQIANATIVGRLQDAAGNAAELSAPSPVQIDTLAPQIKEVTYTAVDADGNPIQPGDVLPGNAVLTVKLTSDLTLDPIGGSMATFSIEGLTSRLPPADLLVPLYDDGTHGDQTAQDGVYTGSYTVKPGDDVTNALLLGTLTKANKKSATQSALVRLTIDTLPPPPITAVTAVDRPADEGAYIILSWQDIAGDSPDLTKYNLYRSQTPIVRLHDFSPVEIIPRAQFQGQYLLAVPQKDANYYFAVTGVDAAGNESELDFQPGGSTSEPVKGRDNTPPEPITGLAAEDTPDDAGKTISLAWLPSPAPDFWQYNIYLAETRIETKGEGQSPLLLEGRQPILSVSDRHIVSLDVPVAHDKVDYYFAVTAMDDSDNESPLSASSLAGPVQSIDNLGAGEVEPVKIISLPFGGQIRSKTITFHWMAYGDTSFSGGYFYRFDNGGYQFTKGNHVTFYNLREGTHTFNVKSAVGDTLPATRSFFVLPAVTFESEANDSPAAANPLTAAAIMRGQTADDADEDWYLIRIDRDALLDLHLERPAGVGATTAQIFNLAFSGEDAALGELTLTAQNRQRSAISLGVNHGDYLLQIRAAGENPGSEYELSLAVTEIQPEFRWDIEPNGAPEFATFIPVQSSCLRTGKLEGIPAVGEIEACYPTIFGQFNKAADVDWYRLDVMMGGGLGPLPNPPPTFGAQKLMLNLEAISPLNTQATDVSIYAGDPTGEAKGIGAFKLTPQNGQGWSFATPVSIGNYFLRINPQSEDTAAFYALRATLYSLESAWELEPNSTPLSANELKADASIYGASWHSDDIDWVKIRLTKAGILTLAVEQLSGAENIEVSLLTSGGQRELGQFKVGNELEPIGYFDAEITPGEYLVKIDPRDVAPEVFATSAMPKYRLTALLIKSAYHSAGEGEILGVGADLTVTLEWQPEAVFPELAVTFDIIDKLDNRLSSANLQPQSDGIYSLTHRIQPDTTNITDGTIFINLDQADGVSSGGALRPLGRVRLKKSITIDTRPPEIVSVRHNAVDVVRKPHPLTAGMALNVRVETIVAPHFSVGEADSLLNIDASTFEISGGDFKIREELFDDGQHDDDAANDGLLGGVYIVQPGDNVEEAELTAYIEDIAGNKAVSTAEVGVTFDTLKPKIESLTPQIFKAQENTNGVGEKTLVAGDRLQVELRGEKGGKAEFDLEGVGRGELFDDGTHSDEKHDDGVYTSSYVIRAGENAQNALITGRLKDKAGNIAELDSQILVTIDTTKPTIEQVTLHLGGGNRPYPSLPTARPIIRGEILVVIMKGEEGGFATFDIGELQTGLPMVDDGAGEDEGANDGEYVGIYEVQAGDDAPDVAITVQLIDKAGNQEMKAASQKATIDAVPPNPVNIIRANDKPGDEGNVIIVEWEESSALDFAHYNIYAQAQTPIRYTLGLIPLKSSLFKSDATVAEIILPKNNLAYYIAVTVVDIARNVSPLAEAPDEGKMSPSVFGPVQAKDNIPPQPVIGVTAKDKPNDQGKTLIVEWAEVSREEDFERYLIYVSDKKIDGVGQPQGVASTPVVQLSNRDTLSAEVPVEDDGVNYYVAVTALDQNGNQSPPDASGKSVFGPVQTQDELPPTPVLGVITLDTQSDRGGKITVSWFPKTDEGVKNYNIYLSAQAIAPKTGSQKVASPLGGDTADIFVAEGEQTDTIDVTTENDNENYYLAVTAVDFGGNESLLDDDENSTAGPVQSVSNAIMANAKTVITAGFDPNTKIILEPNTAVGGDMVDIFAPTKEPIDADLLTKINEANGYLIESHIDKSIDDDLKDTVRQFVFYGDKFSRPVTIVLSYPEGITDRRIEEENMRIFTLSEESAVTLWKLAPGKQTVDNTTHTVAAEFNWPSSAEVVFRVAVLKFPDSLDEAVIYPNPFYPKSQEQVNFLYLTQDAIIEIYTLNGELVRTIESEAATGRAKWNGRNQEGKEVVGGLYICLIKSETDKTVRKIMVMR